MISFKTFSEELRIGTDAHSIVRTFSFVKKSTEQQPREELLFLIALPDKPKLAETLVQKIAETLQKICFAEGIVEGLELDGYERFESALKEVNSVIADFQKTLPNQNIGQINAVIGFLTGANLHLTQTGESEAYLIRHGALTAISEGLLDESAVDVFSNIATGTVEHCDKIVFASERLLRYATKNELSKIFSPQKEIGLALEELDEIITLEGAQGSGVLACDIQNEAASQVKTPLAYSFQDRKFSNLAGKLDRGLTWVRERLPESVNLPYQNRLNFDKNYLILGFLAVLILILLSFSWNLGEKKSSETVTEVRSILEDVQTKLDLAKAQQNIGNKAKAYELIAEIEVTANDLLVAGLAIEEATNILEEIKLVQDSLDNIKRYNNLTPLVNIKADTGAATDLIGLTDFHGRKISFNLNKLFDVALDKVMNSQTIEEISTLKVGKYSPDRDSLIFLSVDDKIIEWRENEPALIDTEDAAWKSAADLSFYSSFLYLLDPTNNQIWKYAGRRNGFGPAKPYNENANLTQAVALAIDGDIWVLLDDEDADMRNDIVRLRKGEKKELTISDLPNQVLENPSKIFTNEELRFVYVLDPTARRIFRFYKDPPEPGSEYRNLIYNTQYFFENLTTVQDFWVDPAEQKLFLVDEEALYEITI